MNNGRQPPLMMPDYLGLARRLAVHENPLSSLQTASQQVRYAGAPRR